jgi:hypothetical protein
MSAAGPHPARHDGPPLSRVVTTGTERGTISPI